MLKVFTGWDEREAAGWHTFAQSVIQNATQPIALIPLGRNVTQREGTNRFTYARFLVPWLCDFRGFAVFVDGCDMLCKGDITELTKYVSLGKSLAVAPHDYKTKYKIKYLGTELESANEDYPGKNQSSAMVFDCGHYTHRILTPEYVNKAEGLHQFSWIKDRESIGELPLEWNWLADEYGENPKAKLLHWTAGIPGFNAYSLAPHSYEWKSTMLDCQRGMQYQITVER